MFSNASLKKSERVKRFFDKQSKQNDKWRVKIAVLENVILDLPLERQRRRFNECVAELTRQRN